MWLISTVQWIALKDYQELHTGTEFLGLSERNLKENSSYFRTSWNCPKPWWSQLRNRESPSSVISKGFIIAVLKCQVTTKRHEKSGLWTISPSPESSQQKRTGTRELFLCLIHSPLLGNKTHFSDWGRDSGLGAVRQVPKEVEESGGTETRKPWKTYCCSPASLLPLKLERPSEVGQLSGTVK